MNYRDIIRGVREDRDDTQARIGEVLNKSQQGYSHIESGRAELKIDDLIKLCKFYNLSADYLIGLTSTPRSCKGRHTSTGRAGGCVPSLFSYTLGFAAAVYRPCQGFRARPFQAVTSPGDSCPGRDTVPPCARTSPSSRASRCGLCRSARAAALRAHPRRASPAG